MTPIEIQRLIVRLVGDTKGYQSALREAEKTTEKFTTGTDGRIRDSKGRFVAAQRAIQNEIEKTVATLRNYGQQITALGSKLESVAGKMRSLSIQGSLGITMPATLYGGMAFREHSNYESVMLQMVSLAGVGREELEGIDKILSEMATRIGIVPKELAESYQNIRGSGLEGARALEALEASAKAAATGLGTTAVVSDAVTSAMNAYAAQGLKASRATDILTAAVDAGKLEAESLAPVLGRLLPTASSMGIQFEQVAGILAVMSRTGLNAAEASTSLGAVMNTLNKPSAQSVKLLSQVGLSMGELREIARGPGGLIEVMRLLDNKFKDNEEALATIIPNTRAFSGAMNVLAQEAEIVDDVMSQVVDSIGKAETAFQVAEGSAAREMAKVWAALKTVMIDIGSIVAPTILSVAEWVKEWLTWFNRLEESTKKWLVTIAAIAAAIPPLLGVLATATVALASITTAIGTLVAGETVLGVSLAALTTAFAALVPAIIAAAAALTYNLHPATAKVNSEIERTTKFGDAAAKRFEENTRATIEASKAEGLSHSQRIAVLQKYQKDLEHSYKKQEELEAFHTKEIRRLRGAYIGSSIIERHGIRTSEAEKKQAQELQKSIKKQLDLLDDELKALHAAGKTPTIPVDIMADIRPEAIEKFEESFRTQLRNLELENYWRGEGRSDSQIRRIQQFRELEAALLKEGEKINQAERDRLQYLSDQLDVLERQKIALAEQEKKEQDMARKAQRIIENQMTPIESLKNQIKEIEELWIMGALTTDQANLAASNLVSAFAAKSGTSMSPNGGAALIRGTREAYAATTFGQSPKTTEQDIRELVKQTKVSNVTQEQILQAIKDQQNNPQVRIARI